MKRGRLLLIFAVSVGLFLALVGCNQPVPSAPAPTAPAQTTISDDVKKAIDNITAALPKFAIPMREVGDRFDNMYFAAKGGNWGLAAYMSKYMNGAMNPAKLTKPDLYPTWSSFYSGTFDPVNKAITAKDFAAFDKAYTAVIDSCNGCHTSTGYKFIKIVKVTEPVDKHNDNTVKSEPGDVPK